MTWKKGGWTYLLTTYLLLLQRKRLKKAGGRLLDSIPTQERERLEGRALRLATQYRSMSLIFLATPFRWRPLSFQKDFH